MASNMKDLERLLQKGRKSSRRVPVKAGSWLSNAIKSVGYSSMDIIKDMMPNTVELGQSAAQSATDIKDSIRNLGTQRGKLKSAFNESIYGQLTKEAIQNTIADFKSGDFYNRSRELAYAEKAMEFDDDDFDFGFDDDFDDTEDFDANLESDDDGASVSINRSHKGRNEATRITLVNNIGPDSAIVKATELQTQVTAKGVGILVDAGKANTQVSLAIMNRIGNDVNKGMTVINQTISDTGTTIASSIDKFSAISGKYYDDSLALYTRMADSLDIIKQQTAVGAAASAIRDAKDVPNVLDMFSGGTISISDYKKFVKKNFSNWVDNDFVASQVKNMLFEQTDTLGSIVQIPLRSIAKNIAEQFIPNMVQRSMKEFDRSVGEFAITALTKLGSREDSSNPVLSALASIFGIRNKMNTRVDKRNYEKGPVPFDGITHRTINDVIPTYLRQIASALTGKEEFAFDYNEGVYRTLSEIKEKHKSDLEYEKLSPFSTDIGQFNEMLSKTYTAATEEQLTAIENDFKTFLSRMVDVGGIPNYRKKAGKGDFGEITDYISELLDMPNDRRSADIIRNALEGRYRAGLGSENIRMFGRSVQEARNNVSRMTSEREANQLKYNDNLIDNGLESFNNATIRLKRKGYYGGTRVSDSRGPLADKYGHKPTYYLREILKTLTGGINVNVLGNTGDTTPGGGSSPTGLYNDLLNEEQNQFRRERSIVHITPEATRIKDLDNGKLDLDSDVDFNDETMLTNSQRYFSGVVDEERGTRKKSIFEKFSTAPGTIGKWMRGISATINKSSSIAQTTLNTANEFIYTILFGNDKGRKGLGAAFDYIWAGMKLQFKKVGTFVNDKILKPIDNILFGDNGIITKLKQSEIFKGFKDKASKIKDKVSGVFFGEKIKNPDGSIGYNGGLFSNTLNELKDVGTCVKESIIGKKGPDGKSLPIEQDNSVFGNLKKIGLRLSDSIHTTLGLDNKGKDGKRLSFREAASTGLKSVWSHTKKRFDEWTDLLLGEKTKGDKINTVKDGVTSFANEMKGKSGKLGAGAVLGAVGTGLLSGKLGILGSIFLPGGPIGGALLGTGIAMVTQSNTLKDKLFGPVDEDGKRTGGIITKEIIDFVSDNKTGIKLGAFAGLASSFGLLPAMFFPGGPIGGALAGGAISLAHKAGLFNTMLYGVDGDKNNPTGGLTKKFKDIFGKNKNLKGLALDASMGAGLGIMGSFFLPGGPIVGAMLGSAASIAMNTEKFKSMLFGEVDEETGKRNGGLFGRFKGYMDKKILTPLAKTVETAQADFMFFVKDKMVRPLATAIAPITNKFTEAGEYVASSFKDMVSDIGKKFHDTVTKPLGNTIDKWIIAPLKKIASGIFGAVTHVIGSVISSPFRAIGWIGQSIFAGDKRRGANEASVERSKQAWGDAKTAFATSRANAGGGIKGLFSGLWSGAKALGSGNMAALSKETREAGRWGWRGAGRYATPDKNPKSIDNQLKEQYASEHEKRLAEINAKYSDGNWEKKQSKLNKAKPGTVAGVQAEVSNLSKPLDKIDNNTTTSADETTKISSKIDTIINNENDHGNETNNLLDNIKNILSGISSKIKGSSFNEANIEHDQLQNKGTSEFVHGSLAEPKPRNQFDYVRRDSLQNTSIKYSFEKNEYDDDPRLTFNDRLLGKRPGKNIQRSQTNIASNVNDIADSVHGQLNGVGSNVNKIYRLLGRKIKEENELATRIAENSEDAIRAKQAIDDKAAEDAEYRTKVTSALSNLNATTETHHSIWNSIFGLKGILTGALILFAPFILKNFSKIAGWIANAVVKAIPGIVKGLANSLRSIFYKNSGSGSGFELGKNGTVVLDENGVPSVAETSETSAIGAVGNLLMPTRTIIDSRTGKAHNVREWTQLSGAMVNAARAKTVKIPRAIVKGKAWQTAYNTYKASGIKNAAKIATKDIDNKKIGTVMTVANKGAESLTKIAGKAKDKIVTAANSGGVISKFIDLAKKAVTFLKTKIDDFLLKHNSKMGGKLSQLLGKMTSSLSEKVVKRFGPKVAQVMSKLSAAASTLLLSDVAWGALGALNTNPAQVFQVNKKDVDWKMQLIARFWKGIMSTGTGAIIDLVIQIASSLLGFDLGSELCVQMYKVLPFGKSDAKLDASREKFKEEYDAYSQEEYAAYVENAQKNGESYMSYEEFMQSGLGTKFEDYNSRENKTVVKKIMDGASVVGGGLVKGTKAVIGAPVKLAKAAGSGIKSAGTGAISAFKNAFTGEKDPASKVMGILSGKDRSGNLAQDAADAVVSATLAPLNFVTSGLRNALGFVSKSMGDMDKVSKDVDDAADVFATDVNGNNYFKSKAKTNTFSGLISNMMFSVLRGTMSPLFFLKTGLSGDKNKTSIFGKLKNAGSWLLDKLGFGKKTNVDETGGSGGFGGDVYFSQNDPRIANAPYKLSDGRYDTMGNRGCGPTAMAMVANSVGGRGLDPLSMANDATKAGFSTDVGTTPGFFDYEASKLGIGSSRMPASKSNISTSLSSGNPVIIQGSDTNPNSPFTPQGHYVVGTKVDGDRVAIKDPRGPQYSGLYDINAVTSGASNMWSFGGKGGIRYGKKRKGGFGGLTAEAVVKVAAGEIGYIEKASNSQLDDKTANSGDANYTKYGVVTGTNGDYWCASFVCWCFMQAAGSKQAATAALCGGFSAACNSMMNAFKTAQRFDKTPRVGDCIFFVGTRHGGANHVGIVCGIDDQNVYTIEGNTSGGSTVVDNGGCVAAKQYPLNYAKILGYGHPVFDTAVSSTFNGLTDLSKGNTIGTTTVSTNNTGTSTSSDTLSTGGIASIGEFLSGYANAFMSPLLKSFGFNTDDSIDSTSTNTSSTVSTNDTGTSDITYSSGDDYIGKYVRKYESGSKGSAMISSGTGDHGGVSFGTYQFPSNRQSITESGNLPAFWNKYYASQYPGVKPGDNDAFKKAWLDAVNKDPEAFSKREHEFIASKYYTPISAALKTNGVGDPTSYDRGAQEAAWSSAVQYGPTKAAELFKDSGVNTSMDPKTFITKLYDYKQANVPTNFKSSSTSVQKSIVQRFGNEKNDLLQLAGNKPIQPSSGGMGGMGGYPMSKYKQMTSGGYGTSVKGLATPNYTKAPILGGFGGVWDTASVTRVIALLERIANDMTSTSEGIDSLNSKDFTNSSYNNNSKLTTNHNTVNAADKSANMPVSGKDRSGYALAKQLAKGTFAFS